MATTHDDPQTPPRPDSRSETPSPWQRFYRRYSGHGELPRSTLVSVGSHLLLAFVLILMASSLMTKDQTPPAVDVVHVGDDSSAAPGEGDGEEASGDAMEATEPSDSLAEEMSESQPAETVKTDVEVDVPTETVAPTADELVAETEKAAKRTAAAADRAKAALQRAKDRLKQNMTSGAGSGSGGGGGSGTTGRAARPARWVLKFKTGSVQDYLAQWEGLGAKIAFPAAGDKYRYFSDLTSGSPTSEVRDLSGEGRLYWIDDDAASAARVAQALGVSPTDFFLAFLPLEVEERMLKLELAAAGVPEDQIATTHFVVVPRGGGYEVQVLKTVLK
ncbi:MAG TPA: hypothetical protein VFI31_24870 [Pirellulales bacterium]|nr:hypothetical protein [Pirellulales bacterium]